MVRERQPGAERVCDDGARTEDKCIPEEGCSSNQENNTCRPITDVAFTRGERGTEDPTEPILVVGNVSSRSADYLLSINGEPIDFDENGDCGGGR